MSADANSKTYNNCCAIPLTHDAESEREPVKVIHAAIETSGLLRVRSLVRFPEHLTKQRCKHTKSTRLLTDAKCAHLADVSSPS